MTGRKNFHAITGKVALMVVLFCVLGVSSASAQDWHFGIGTGLVRMNAQGDQGLNIAGVGPILADVDLDPDDFDDLIQTAIGFGGYATNGKWMVQYMLASIKMGGEPSGTLPGGAAFTSDLSFDVTTGFLTLGYTAYRQGRLSIQPFVGMRYFKHELGADVSVATAPPTDISASVDHNWTDVLVGAALNVALSPKVHWSASFDAGFGGSNGTYNFTTAISWRFWKYMSIGPNFSFMAIDFENGEIGDSDWYIYDANEFGWGASFLIHLK